MEILCMKVRLRRNMPNICGEVDVICGYKNIYCLEIRRLIVKLLAPIQSSPASSLERYGKKWRFPLARIPTNIGCLSAPNLVSRHLEFLDGFLLYYWNLDVLQIKCVRDPTLPLLRVAQVWLSFGSSLLTLRQDLFQEPSIFNKEPSSRSQICYDYTIHNLYQLELIPRQLSLSACPSKDVVYIFVIVVQI